MAEIPFSLGSLTKTSEGWLSLAAPASVGAFLSQDWIPIPDIVASDATAMACITIIKLVVFGLVVATSQMSYTLGRSRVKTTEIDPDLKALGEEVRNIRNGDKK